MDVRVVNFETLMWREEASMLKKCSLAKDVCPYLYLPSALNVETPHGPEIYCWGCAPRFRWSIRHQRHWRKSMVVRLSSLFLQHVIHTEQPSLPISDYEFLFVIYLGCLFHLTWPLEHLPEGPSCFGWPDSLWALRARCASGANHHGGHTVPRRIETAVVTWPLFMGIFYVWGKQSSIAV